MTTPAAAPWETWLADDWRHYCTTHGIPLTDPFLRRLRITRWSQLAGASYDKRARVYALGEPPLPLEAGA